MNQMQQANRVWVFWKLKATQAFSDTVKDKIKPMRNGL